MVSMPPFNNAVDDDHRLFFNGDTVIGLNIYKKIFASGCTHLVTSGGCESYYSNVYQGALRQDTSLRKVFFVFPLSFVDTLLYDFNLSIGDTLPITFINYSPDVFITSIDSVLMGSDYRKRFMLSIQRDWGVYGSLIEGIGSTYGLLNPMIPWFEAGSYLRCFTLNNQTLYQDPAWSCIIDVGINEAANNNSVNISPNPAQNSITITNNQTKELSLTIFSSIGEVVIRTALMKDAAITVNLSTLPSGIYLVKAQSDKNFAVRKFVKQ